MNSEKQIYLVVTPFFPSPTSWRGAYCLDFVRALERTGRYDVIVFKPGTGTDYDCGGIRVRTFKTRQLPSNLFPFLFHRWNQRSFLAKLEQCGIDVKDVAVCHGHTATFSIYPAVVKTLNPKCKTLLHHHDLGSFGLQNGMFRHFWLYNLIAFPILRHWHEKMDLHVFISEMNRRSFLFAPDTRWTNYVDYKRQMRGLPWHPVRIKNDYVLYNGVDERMFRNEERQAHTGFVIGCIGNFNPSKGQMVLLKAVKRLVDEESIDELKVRFIRSGECLESCKRFVAENNLCGVVSFEPEILHENLSAFYRSLDLFVLPSVWDGFGCVYAEAWACSVPFITTEGVGAKELVVDTDKWVARMNDVNDLANKILAYGRNRWKQHLTNSVNIDTLVSKFVQYLCVV